MLLINFIDDIDSLPIPARRLLNPKSYSQQSFLAPVLRSAEIMSSRGCPCSCGFCSTTRVWGRRYRPRSIENLLEEVDQLEAEGINHIYFSDDCFNVDKERTRKFCEHMKKKKDILWCCHQGMITASIDEGLLEDMAESGMYYFALPVESGNQEVLNTLIQKPSNLDHTRKIARKAKELGLYTVGFFILGVPTETKAQIEDTLRFAEELDLDYSAFALFRPYPGTPLTELAKQKGLIVNPKQGVDEFSYYEARIRSDEYDEEYLESKRREIWRKISEPKLKTVMENKDVYYALLEPFVDRFPALFEGKRR